MSEKKIKKAKVVKVEFQIPTKQKMKEVNNILENIGKEEYLGRFEDDNSNLKLISEWVNRYNGKMISEELFWKMFTIEFNELLEQLSEEKKIEDLGSRISLSKIGRDKNGDFYLEVILNDIEELNDRVETFKLTKDGEFKYFSAKDKVQFIENVFDTLREPKSELYSILEESGILNEDVPADHTRPYVYVDDFLNLMKNFESNIGDFKID